MSNLAREAQRRLLDAMVSYLNGIGSPLIDRFLVDWPAALPASVESARLPVLDHFAALPRSSEPPVCALVTALLAAEATLPWRQTYADGERDAAFLRNYGFCEMVGIRGVVASSELAAGFLLLGPDITYPLHYHIAEEVYVPLAGRADWAMHGLNWRQREPGEIIFHASNVPHAMRTGAEPLLALYLWRGGPLAQKSNFV